MADLIYRQYDQFLRLSRRGRHRLSASDLSLTAAHQQVPQTEVGTPLGTCANGAHVQYLLLLCFG